MKTPFFIVLLILFSLPVTAQNDIGHLLLKLKNAPDDTARVDVYNDLFEHYEYSVPDSAIYYLEDGLKQFTERNFRLGAAFMTTLLGYENAAQGHLTIAKKQEVDGLKVFEELNNKKGIILAHNGLGTIEGRNGNYSEATKHFIIALRESENTSNTGGIINTYMNLGVVNELTHNFDKALEFYNKALKYTSDTQLNNSSLTLYNNIGILYAKKGDLKKAFDYFQIALQKSNKPEFAGTYISSLINMGILYDKLDENDKSLKYFNEALQIARERNLPENEAKILVNISSVTTKTNPKKSIELLKEALVIAKRIGQKAVLDDVCSGLVEDYKKVGDYKNAVDVLEYQMNLEDSTFTIVKAKEIANLESVYALEQSNERIKELKTDMQRHLHKRNIIIIIAICLAITLILVSVFYRKTILLNEKLSKREAELAKSNNVKDKLFSIIGHDLRGPIGNIPMMLKILEEEGTSADEREYLLNTLLEHSYATMETLDKLLYWGKSQIKDSGIKPENFSINEYLNNDIKLIKNSTEQKQITLVNKIKSDVNIYGDPTHFDFIFRNLLSNAVKFTRSNGTIEISADKNKLPGFTIFSIQDNGIGIEKEKLAYIFEPFNSSMVGTANERGTSMGLMLCKEFVIENGGSIWVESEYDQGSTFYFSFKNA